LQLPFFFLVWREGGHEPGLLLIEDDERSEPVEYELTGTQSGHLFGPTAFLMEALEASVAARRVTILPEAGRVLAVRLASCHPEGAAAFTVIENPSLPVSA
jgi:hypothetical protein